MPEYDGTEPKGLGPMAGGGGGFCLLKLSGSADELLTGFVGQDIPCEFPCMGLLWNPCMPGYGMLNGQSAAFSIV
jgi:hypothetical protein